MSDRLIRPASKPVGTPTGSIISQYCFPDKYTDENSDGETCDTYHDLEERLEQCSHIVASLQRNPREIHSTNQMTAQDLATELDTVKTLWGELTAENPRLEEIKLLTIQQLHGYQQRLDKRTKWMWTGSDWGKICLGWTTKNPGRKTDPKDPSLWVPAERKM